MRRVVLFALLAAAVLGPAAAMLRAQDKSSPVQLWIVPFSHFDLSWLGTQKEVESRAVQVLSDAMAKGTANRDYRFFVDGAYLLERYMALRPKQTALLQQLVSNGQLEINPQWALPHAGDNGDEGEVRNIFYAKQFVKENFGVDPRAVSFTDLPEWMVQTPQILRGFGIDFAIKNRLGPPTVPLLCWEGLDGTCVLTAYGGYGGVPLLVHGLTIDAPTMRLSGFGDLVKETAAKTKTNQLLSSVGSDYWRPVKNLERNVAEWNAQPDGVKLRLSTFREYYDQVKELPNIPVVRGEVPDAWVAYPETIFAKSTQDEQAAANLLLSAEKLATAAYLLGSARYPGGKIAEAWKGLARAADHGYVGIGGREADEVKALLRQKALLAAQDMVNDSTAFIAEQVQLPPRPGIPIVVFNPLSWPRTDVVVAHATFYVDEESARSINWAAYPGLASPARTRALLQAIDTWPVGKNDKMRLEDADGHSIEFQETFTSQSLGMGDAYLTFLAADVPPLGYKTYYLYPTREPRRSSDTIQAGQDSLENQTLRVTIDGASGAFSVLQKATGKFIAKRVSVVLASYSQVSDYWSGRPPAALPLKLEEVEILEQGPVQAKLRLRYTVNHPGLLEIYSDLSLTRREQVDIETVVKYDDSKVNDVFLVSQSFPLDLANPQFQYGAPYGYSGKSDLRPGLLEDYPAAVGSDRSFLPLAWYKNTRMIHQWLAVSDQGTGFILASSRRMFQLKDDGIEGMLFGMSPPEPQRAAILHSGRIASRFSIAPLSGSWQEAKSYRLGWELNNPLIPYSVENAAGDRTLPANLSFLPTSPDNSVVTVLKKAEDGDGVIVRVFEAEGRQGTGALKFFQPIAESWNTNLMEERQGAVSLQSLTLKKNEIRTLRLRLSK